LSINDAILQQLRTEAQRSGKSFRAVVEEVLLLGLTSLSKKGRRKKFHVRTHAIGLKVGFQGVSLNQIYDQIEAEDAATKERSR
jgi:hypothetical protein